MSRKPRGLWHPRGFDVMWRHDDNWNNFSRKQQTCKVAHSNSVAFDKENEKRVPRLCFVESPPEEADLTEDPITRHFDITDDEPVDMFSEFYQPYDLTVLESLYPHGMQKSCRYVKSTFFSHYFRVRKGYFNVANLWVDQVFVPLFLLDSQSLSYG